MARFEVDALVVVEAASEKEAMAKAMKLSEMLNADEGPGAFFFEIGVAPLTEAEEIDGEHEAAHLAALPVPKHVEQIASGR